MSDICKKRKLPELLCPAGSPAALDAAIEGGADAVYLGGSAFNARMFAKNFGGDDLRSAVLRAHSYGVKIYLTLNTLVTDRELPEFLRAAYEAHTAGVDALIVADLGGAAAIHRVYPEIELHASTQMSGHCGDMGKQLAELGFSRMVIARETPAIDLQRTVEESPIEIEAFIHGALCVSHSGQCLFSSLVGGRSGNRGECAQPCRLPFACGRKQGYPLSLKDLTLAAHVPALIESGVSSLKIEGRMKSPEYVRDTARIWRRLLDERRAATPEELKQLSEIFSRGGLTDGYFTEKIGHGMLGIRSDADKSQSRALAPFEGITKKLPLAVSAEIKRDTPCKMTLSHGEHSVTVSGEIPQAAINAPMTRESAMKNLTKFGGTPYAISSFDLELDDGLMLPLSKLNELRRSALEALNEAKNATKEVIEERKYLPLRSESKRQAHNTARFYSIDQIPDGAFDYFDTIYLPLHKHAEGIDGVILPPVIFEREMPKVKKMLAEAKKNGATHALVGNVGHLALVREADLIPVGDFRLNATNNETVLRLESLGLSEIILSLELTLPQMRDIKGNTAAAVYGRAPLMTLEKCVIKEIADCNVCASGKAILTDRRGVSFPVLREWEHRNVVYNSLPTCMSDKQDVLDRHNIINRHFIFSVESKKEVEEIIKAHQKKLPLKDTVRRLK
ncbi:MAG: U32 family peptidase [Ruminococcaceae bacterium]|nr:U32 family peptidase [Oscillospiraceae bacterium]